MFESISQSKEYAALYDKRKEALMKAKEDTQFHFNQKKSATIEQKQVHQEKIEVKSHRNRIMCPPSCSRLSAPILKVSTQQELFNLSATFTATHRQIKQLAENRWLLLIFQPGAHNVQEELVCMFSLSLQISSRCINQNSSSDWVSRWWGVHSSSTTSPVIKV